MQFFHYEFTASIGLIVQCCAIVGLYAHLLSHITGKIICQKTQQIRVTLEARSSATADHSASSCEVSVQHFARVHASWAYFPQRGLLNR